MGGNGSRPKPQSSAASLSSSVFRNFDEYNDNGQQQQHTQQSSSSSSSSSSQQSSPFVFTPKYEHSIQNNPLCGIELPQWISLLRRRHHDIEWKVYWPRLLFVTVMSVFNSIMGCIERLLYHDQIQNVTTNPRPVFVLGHPRTGTTLLHSLLALDTDQFTYCNTFCAGFPSCFLWFERYGKHLLKGVMAETRPMDNVKLSFDLPQEEELATCLLSGGASHYMMLYFMTLEPEFRPFLAFDVNDDTTTGSAANTHDDDDDEKMADPSILAEHRKRWINAFLFLVRKLTVRDLQEQSHQNSQSMDDTSQTQKSPQPRRLVLKSPVNTARIPLLLQLFPEAQFIYIHRHPYDVLRSAMHMADTTYWYTYLARPTNEQIAKFILRLYEILYDRYEAGRNQIIMNREESSSSLQTQKSIVEVSFDELSLSPIETMRRIYSELGWNFTSDYEEKLLDEVGDVQSYQRNTYRPLSRDLKDIVNKRWGPSFERFGYAME